MDERKRSFENAVEHDPYGGKGYRDHGDVYRWLRKNYAFVMEWIGKTNPPGSEIAARIKCDGIVGARGEPPTSRSVRKVWQRVCRDMEAGRKREIEEEAERKEREREFLMGVPRQKRGRDLPKDWTPPLAESQGRALVPASLAPTGVLIGPDGKPETSLARIKRKLDEDSGRGPKRSLAEIYGPRKTD